MRQMSNLSLQLQLADEDVVDSGGPAGADNKNVTALHRAAGAPPQLTGDEAPYLEDVAFGILSGTDHFPAHRVPAAGKAAVTVHEIAAHHLFHQAADADRLRRAVGG